MLVRDASGATPVRGRASFADWITGEVELGGRRPTAEDLDYHLTTLFPPVRPRGFLEVRYPDAVPSAWWPAVAAVTATLLDVPAAAEAAAAACEPVAGAWDRAARDGLADPALHAAARACLAAAADAAPPELRADVAALAGLTERGRSPGDTVLADATRDGPAAALLTATETEEAP
jgi:glutamate--cysteine ligase